MSELQIGKGVSLPLSIVTSKASILAMTGQGKTYLAKVIAEEMMNRNARIIVGDYTGVWWGLTSSANGKREGYNVVVFGGEHGDVPINEHSGSLIADVVVNERINAILDVSGFEDDAPKIRFMTAFAKRLYFKNRKPVHFFLDEADEYVPQNPQRDQVAMLAILKRIWQRGRIKGIGGTIISQRSASVHKTLLAQSDMLIAMRTVSPHDRKALAAWFESWGSEDEIKEFESTISNLPEHHAWFWSPRHKLFTLAKARTLKTFDSGATPDVDHGLEIDEPAVRTKHDIAKLGKEIERLAEAQKSEDPIVLQKQLAHYQEQFKMAKGRVELLEQRLSSRPEKVKVERPGKPIKVPALSTRTLKEIGKARKFITSGIAELKDASKMILALDSDMEAIVYRLDKELDRAEKLAHLGNRFPEPAGIPANVPNLRGGMVKVAVSPAVVSAIDVDTGKRVNIATSTAQATNGNGSKGSVTGGRARILKALAQFGRLGYSRLRVLAGIESQATIQTYLSQFRKAGYVTDDPTGYTITQTGLEALGPYDPLPTGTALVDYWKQELGNHGRGRLFAVLVDRPDMRFSREHLKEKTGIQSDATLDTYLSQLRQRGLVETFKDGYSTIDSSFANL